MQNESFYIQASVPGRHSDTFQIHRLGRFYSCDASGIKSKIELFSKAVILVQLFMKFGVLGILYEI